MTDGNKDILKNMIDLSLLGISFLSKPLVVGGLAMEYKVISFDKLFFMTAAAARSEPEVKKRVDDFGLALGYYYNKYRNQEYVANAELHNASYINAPNGTIFNDRYGFE